MKQVALVLVAILGLPAAVIGQSVPPADKLLPADTLGVITVPDMAAARRLFNQSPQMQLWRDPALAPFVNKFWSKLETQLLQPLEQEMGTSLTNFLGLAQGQLTLAVTRNGWPVEAGATPGLAILIDARDQAERLTQVLAEGRTKLAAKGEPMKTQRIGGTEFLVLTVQPPALKAPQADDADEAKDPAVADPAKAPDENAATGEAAAPMPAQELFIGQAGSLLVVSSGRVDLEKIMTLKSGGAVMALGESADFMPDYASTLREATIYGWLNLEPILEAARQLLPGAEAGLPLGLSPARMLSALGLSGLKTLSFAASIRGDGATSEMKVRIPDEERRGLFRMLAFAAKDSGPTPFVPADALTFSRTRLDLQKSWNTLEATVSEIAPQIGGLVKMTVDAIGKDKDPGFDFRKQFVANLGDDVITWQTAAKTGEVSMAGPPQVALISSPKPEQLAGALKLLMGMVPPDVAKLEESDVAGVKVWSMGIPMGLPAAGQAAPPVQTIAFASANGYLAVATDLELLKNYLAAKPADTTSLLARPGFRAAADKVGGVGTGMFGFSNDRETMRSVWDALTAPAGAGTNPSALLFQQLLAASTASGDGGSVTEWIDVSLLPPFEKVQKYFHYSVYAGALSKEAFTLKYFAPTPPGL